VTLQSITWDAARVGGLLAYALLTASVAFGLALSLGWRSTRWNRFVTNEVHRYITILALVFAGLHGLAIAVDPFIKMGIADLLIPFHTSYRPIWVSMGILAGYTTLAVYLSERARKWIGYAWWRRFHGLAFGAFLLALVHGIATGSDTRTPWALGLYIGSIVLVGFLLFLRLLPDAPKIQRPFALAVAMTTAVVVVVFTFAMPLQAGWSARAGGVIPSVSAAPTPGFGVVASQPLQFSGELKRSDQALQVSGTTQDGTAAFLVQLTASESGVAGEFVLQTGTDQVCTGTVTAVQDASLTATCSTVSGDKFSVVVDVQQASEESISGTVELTPTAGASAS